MIQVFSHMQDGLQLISWPVIGFTLNVSGFFHVGVFTHLKAHLHFTLLANARKRLRYGVLIFIEPTSARSRVRVSAKRSCQTQPHTTGHHLLRGNSFLKVVRFYRRVSFYRRPLSGLLYQDTFKNNYAFIRRVVIYHYWLSVSYLSY